MHVAVDVAPKSAGLVPLWTVPVALIIWLLLFWLARYPLRRWLHTVYRDVAALGALVLANLLFFWQPLLTSASAPRGGGDLNSYFFPLQAFSAISVHSGKFPLWNPHLFGGMPQLANYQAAMLYPPNLIAWLIQRPYSYGTLEFLVIGQYLIASVGTYFLARSLGASRFPATLAAIIFSSSGFLTAHFGHYSMLSVAVWLPWLLLTLRKTALSDSWLWTAAAAVVTYLAATGGHQQLLLYELTAGGAWWLFWVGTRRTLWPWESGGQDFEEIVRAVRTRLKPLVFDIVRAASAMIAGLGMAAPMIIPSLQMASLSVRTGLSYSQATEFSAEPVALLQFLLPKAFGSNPTDYWGSFSSGEIWGYVGIVTLVLAAIALATRPSGVRLLLAGFSVVALLFALGPATPLHGWVFRFVPPYNLIRAPARGYVFVDLSLALLAGFGLQEISYSLAESDRVRLIVQRVARWLLIGFAALALLIVPLFYSLILGVNAPSNRPVIAVDGLNLAVIYLAGVLALLWAVTRGKIRGSIVCLLGTSLVMLDLYGATASFNPAVQDLTAGFRHPQAVSFLQQQMQKEGPFRISSTTLAWQPDAAAIYGLDDAGGLYDPMQPAAYKKVSDVLSGGKDPALYDLLNVRYVITDSKASAPSPSFSKVLQTGDGLIIWENHSVLPRARLAYAAKIVSSSDALNAVTSANFDPASTLYVSGNVAPAVAGGTGAATITSYQSDRVSIHVQTSKRAYLVLADTAYPGWVASVDGVQTPIATADGVFRVISVPAGAHDVLFQFKPAVVTASAVVAGASAGFLIIVIAVGAYQWFDVRRRAR